MYIRFRKCRNLKKGYNLLCLECFGWHDENTIRCKRCGCIYLAMVKPKRIGKMHSKVTKYLAKKGIDYTTVCKFD